MKVYIVLLESGTVYKVYKSKSSAVQEVEKLNGFYEKASIKEEVVR